MKIHRSWIFSLAAVAAFLSLPTGIADEKRVIELWPNGAPSESGNIAEERDMTKDSDNLIAGRRVMRLGNVSKPTITLYPAPKEKANGASVLVCPGGGYHILAWDLEGTEICEQLNEMGITAVLLKYRVPRRANRAKHAAPLEDAQRAIGLIRQNAREWGVDPNRVGILGFSAGGHLAAAASNEAEGRIYQRVDAADDLNARPNFSILIYPGYLASDSDREKLAPEFKIDGDTPQSFIVMTADDPVRVDNALVYATALAKEKVPFELHIHPTGGHGYGLRKTELPVTNWGDRLKEWLDSRDLLKRSL